MRSGRRVIGGSGSGLIGGNLEDNRDFKSEIDLEMEFVISNLKTI